MGPNRTFVLGHGARVRSRLVTRFGVAVAGCTLTLMGLAPAAVASIDDLAALSGVDGLVTDAIATVPSVAIPDPGPPSAPAQASGPSTHGAASGPELDPSVVGQTPVPAGTDPLDVSSAPGGSAVDVPAGLGTVRADPAGRPGAADAGSAPSASGDQRSAATDTAGSPDSPTPAAGSGPTSIGDDGLVGSGDDGRALGVPLVLLAGIGGFLVLTGTATSRSSKFSEAPLHRAGSLRFPEARP